MLLKVIPRRKIFFKFGDLKNFVSLYVRGSLTQGNRVVEFEDAFASYIGTNHAIAVSSGRVGLQLILRALNLAPGDEVLLPAFTFNAVPRVIEDMGFKPVFVDIDPHTYNIDPGLAAKKTGSRTKVLLITHIFGNPCDINKLLEIAGKHNLIVIEDCAQAVGAQYNNKKTGSFGHCSFFSFESVKPFSTYGGGAITTNHEDIALNIRAQLESYPYPKPKDLFKRLFFSFLEFILTSSLIFSTCVYPILLFSKLLNKDPGKSFRKTKNKVKIFNTKYTNFQAHLGIKRLETLEEYTAKRTAHADILTRKLAGAYRVQHKHDSASSIYYSYAIESSEKEKLVKQLLFKKIDADSFNNHNCFENETETAWTEYPAAHTALTRLIQVPVYHQLKKRDLDYIAGILNSITPCQ
ncbi:MAG: DegT/DnrJ/EryC1/StrS aminotransferase family protein [bacterium]|nr:DegT/DnrJ/EryC1/StrS aminotransferase family protein [bacterium]